MIVSDHQPMLFGHTGAWSKVGIADEHIVSFDCIYREEERLASGLLLGQKIQMPLRKAPLIAGVVPHYDRAWKAVRGLEYFLANKKAVHREKVQPVVEILRTAIAEEWSYMEIWLAVFYHLRQYLPRAPTLHVVTEPAPKGTPFSTNWGFVERLVPKAKIYVCGPYVEEYKRPDEQCPIPILIHRMNNPNPRSFLEVLACEDDPMAFLMDFTLTPIGA